MKAKHVVITLFIAVLASAGGWFAARFSQHDHPPATKEGGARTIKYYQSAMHPWITSPKPGKCTVCGMDLVPVYEGDKGFGSGAGVVSLGSNSVQVLNVQTELVGRRALNRTLRVAGLIEYNDTRLRRLAAGVDGRIEKLLVSVVGTDVTEGQPLATIYSTTVQQAAREYQSLVRQNVPAASPPELQEERVRQRLIARQRLFRYGMLESQVNALTNQETAPFTFDLLAPITGTLVQRDASEGQYVKDGDKLFDIIDLYPMWFSFDVYEKDLPWIHVGQLVDMTTAALPGKSYTFPVALIDPNISDPTRSAKVRVALQNPPVSVKGQLRREFYHKLYAEGAVRVDAGPDVLAVPRQAVLNTGDRVVAYVDLGGGNYQLRQLKLGRRGDEYWEILDGLTDGERIVTSGNLLIDGQAQLNQTISAGQGGTNAAPPVATLPPLTEPQFAAAKEFIVAADAVTAALAADNLADFDKHAAKLHTALGELVTAFDAAPAWQALVKALEAKGHLATAQDLAVARKSFQPFSDAAAAFAKALRAQPGELATLKIFQCQMADAAVPGAPKKSEWLQLQGPIRNPYFGAKMIDCGAEVKP